MQIYYQIIEQLDLAANQYIVEGSNYARFCLILTDNAIELMLQEEASKIASLDESGGWIRPPQYSKEARKKATNGNFHDKNDFCLEAGKISTEEHDFIKIAHKFRNDLYHSGVVHQNFCKTLAWYYHDLACQLLPRLSGFGFSWGSNDEISETIKSYTTEFGLNFENPQKDLDSVSRKLSLLKLQQCEPLPKVLSQSILKDFESTQYSLDFLVSDNFSGYNQSKIIYELQLIDCLQNTDLSKIKTPKDWVKHREVYEQKWTPKYKRNPIPRWNKRAIQIEKLTDNSRALNKFDQLRIDSRWFSKLVGEAAIALDGEIQMQFDAYRGK
ncbi:MAG: hypothetical protein AAGG38_06810 [Planctomycetota bacterium]